MNETKAIELLKPHRHAGRDYQAGQTINLPAHKADWLIAKEVGKAAQAAGAKAAQAAAPGIKGKE